MIGVCKIKEILVEALSEHQNFPIDTWIWGKYTTD